MNKRLERKNIAILVTDGFEQSELTEPKKALEHEGATVYIVSPKTYKVKGWNRSDWGDDVVVDVPLEQAQPTKYDALMLPGGVLNPDKLRINDEALRFIKDFFQNGKPVAAICHGPWTLIEIGAVRGKTMTSWPSLKSDLKNAGANWVDEEVVVDNGLITSRKPDDLPAFCAKMIEAFAERKHMYSYAT